jgi:hypothetical protein
MGAGRDDCRPKHISNPGLSRKITAAEAGSNKRATEATPINQSKTEPGVTKGANECLVPAFCYDDVPYRHPAMKIMIDAGAETRPK